MKLKFLGIPKETEVDSHLQVENLCDHVQVSEIGDEERLEEQVEVGSKKENTKKSEETSNQVTKLGLQVGKEETTCKDLKRDELEDQREEKRKKKIKKFEDLKNQKETEKKELEDLKNLKEKELKELKELQIQKKKEKKDLENLRKQKEKERKELEELRNQKEAGEKNLEDFEKRIQTSDEEGPRNPETLPKKIKKVRKTQEPVAKIKGKKNASNVLKKLDEPENVEGKLQEKREEKLQSKIFY